MENTTPTPSVTPSDSGMPMPPVKKTNVFLLVICILTFVGSGFGILSSIFSYAMANTVSSMNSQYEEQMDNQQTPGFLKSLFQAAAEKSDPATLKETALASLVSNLLTLFGAIMMLKLKKTGFYLYVAGILIFILIPALLKGGAFGIAGSLIDGVIGIAFVVMYAVNLKSMNPEQA